jgi:hypothetical protein
VGEQKEMAQRAIALAAAELNDARLSLLETEWELMQAKYAQIVAAAKTRFAAGL